MLLSAKLLFFPWRAVILEKLMVVHNINKLLPFLETEYSWLCYQVHAIGPRSEVAQSSPRWHITFNIITPTTVMSTMTCFPSGFLCQTQYRFSTVVTFWDVMRVNYIISTTIFSQLLKQTQGYIHIFVTQSVTTINCTGCDKKNMCCNIL